MKDGKFEQVGFPQDLYHNPHTAFVAGFVGDRNCWAGRIVSSVDDTLKVKTESCMKIICNSVRLGSKKVGTQVKVFERPEFITTE